MNVTDVHSQNNSDVGFPFPKQDSHRKKKSNDHSSFNSKCKQGLFAFQQKVLVIFNGLSPVLLSD